MTYDELRKYAQRTARELSQAGKTGTTVFRVVQTPHSTTRTEGVFRKRVMTETTYSTHAAELFTGWMLWQLDGTICEFHSDHVHEGWTHVLEIWLTNEGELAYLGAKRKWWNSRSAPNPEDLIETVEIPAPDSAITAADTDYTGTMPPKLPRRPKGLYESHARWRPTSRPAPPGLRISRSLTELCKASGTHVERPRKG